MVHKHLIYRPGTTSLENARSQKNLMEKLSRLMLYQSKLVSVIDRNCANFASMTNVDLQAHFYLVLLISF